MEIIETRLTPDGNVLAKKVKLYFDGKRIYFKTERFSRAINAEVKTMEGHQYHGYDGAPRREYARELCKTDKVWSVEDTPRNRFNIDWLKGRMINKVRIFPNSNDPFLPYTQDLVPFNDFIHKDVIFEHQKHMVRWLLTRRQGINAGEMGTAKTLVDIEVREFIQPKNAWFVGPKSVLKEIELQLKFWGATVIPRLLTYDRLWRDVLDKTDYELPDYVTFDEASRLKTPTTNRARAAKQLTDAMRQVHGRQAIIHLMTGAPSPLCPTDWFWLCEIACPGFLKEGDFKKFERRLVVYTEVDYGNGPIWKIKCWKDRDDICDVCGETQHPTSDHKFKLAINEVAKLSQRTKGLVLVTWKKDCIDLPEKRYVIRDFPPTHETLMIARALANTAKNASDAMITLRTFSDGFLYEDEVVGKQPCFVCNGEKEHMDWVAKTPDPPPMESYVEEQGLDPEDCDQCLDKWREEFFIHAKVPCFVCDETGLMDKVKRITNHVGSPKEDAFREDLAAHEEVGRLVAYGAFTGSINMMVNIAGDANWGWIRVDGRGWVSNLGGKELKHLELFQEGRREYPKVVFIGHPQAAGMGLTLTASPTCIYYSNTHNAEDRIQSEDRIHRPGADPNKGVTIKDYFHLPTDRLCHAKIEIKRKRQNLTMGIDVNMAEILETLG